MRSESSSAAPGKPVSQTDASLGYRFKGARRRRRAGSGDCKEADGPRVSDINNGEARPGPEDCDAATDCEYGTGHTADECAPPERGDTGETRDAAASGKSAPD